MTEVYADVLRYIRKDLKAYGMDTDVMIRQLRVLAENHKNDKVRTFQTRWSDLCTDVANRLEEQEEMINKLNERFENTIEERYMEGM